MTESQDAKPIDERVLTEKLEKIFVQRGKTGYTYKILFLIAVFFAFIEIFYVLHLNITFYRLFSNLGYNLDFLLKPSVFNQTYPAKAIILATIVFSAFLLYPIKKTMYSDKIPLYDWILAILASIGPLYIVYLYVTHHTVEASIRFVTPATLIIIFLAIFGIAEATRRAIGPILPIIMLVFVGYGFLYAYTHQPHEVTGIQWTRRLLNLFIGQNTGLLGTPLEVMVTYVFAFLFFSSLLRYLGIGEYITQLILSLIGKKPGGPAKVSVFSSALMGMISGSSVANVLTTGTFSIPAMKKAGFPPESAGAIEPVASTGGQLMPPIMGAAAFIMAEFLGVPYKNIIIAAALPAIFYFYSIYVFVDKESKRLGLRGLDETPSLRPLLRKIYFILPIPVIIVALLKIEPQHAVMAALSSAIIVAWVSDEKLNNIAKLFLVGSQVVLALILYYIGGLHIATVLFAMGTITLLIAIFGGIAYNGAKKVASSIIASINATLRDSVPVFLAAASASVVQAIISFTGLAKTLGDVLLTASMGNLFLLLIMVAIFSLILGMGVPTTANYIITATILAPTLVAFINEHLGLAWATAALSAHMFVFYYGILADLTPPVALAAFVGATIAGADFWKTSVNAVKYGIAKYILPFIFVLSPYILVVGIPQWGTTEFIQLGKTLVTLIIIIHTIASGFTGWLGGPIRQKWVRALLIIMGFATISMNNMVTLLTLLALTGIGMKQYFAFRGLPVIKEAVEGEKAENDFLLHTEEKS